VISEEAATAPTVYLCVCVCVCVCVCARVRLQYTHVYMYIYSIYDVCRMDIHTHGYMYYTMSIS
jgi:hypothetical protein